MGSTKIHRKFVINEYPNIVTSSEAKFEIRFVSKLSVRFKTVMLVTICGPTIRCSCSRRAHFNIRSFLEEMPTLRSAPRAGPTNHTSTGSTTDKINGESHIFITTATELAFAIFTLVPTGAVTKNIKFRHTFCRIQFTESRAIEHRAFCSTFHASNFKRFLRRVCSQDDCICIIFSRIESTGAIGTRAMVEVRVKLPLTVGRTFKWQIIAALFVHVWSVTEHLVKVRFINEALPTRSTQLRLSHSLRLARIKFIFHKTLMNSNTRIYSSYGSLLINTLGTSLATFTGSRVARECRMQLGIGIINNSGHGVRACSFDTTNFGLTIIEAILIGFLVLIGNKEEGVSIFKNLA